MGIKIENRLNVTLAQIFLIVPCVTPKFHKHKLSCKIEVMLDLFIPLILKLNVK
jgi:hypothetical protein